MAEPLQNFVQRGLRYALPLAGLVGGCSAGGDLSMHPAGFPSPWQGLEPSEKTVSGGFVAVLNGRHPGGGWFQGAQVTGRDASRAALHQLGTDWPVVQIQLYGYANPGWHVLEIDVAQNHWVAGEIPFDGTAAVGQLQKAGGELRYLVDGSLHLTRPGMNDGEVIEGWFVDVVLTEPAP